ncbi:hypothetical protein EDD85DRAFT_368695 [Armillaria nabsnona]|nr:hypothetical protein EDD85DRAFT_368695 [Armillaria nabsnona]
MNGRTPSPVCAFDEYLRDGGMTILRAPNLVDLGRFSLPDRVNFLLGESSGYFLGLDPLFFVTSCIVVAPINRFCFPFHYRPTPRREITLFVIVDTICTATRVNIYGLFARTSPTKRATGEGEGGTCQRKCEGGEWNATVSTRISLLTQF